MVPGALLSLALFAGAQTEPLPPAPAVVVEPAPVDEPAPAEEPAAKPADACLTLLREGKSDEAARCWEQAARADDDNDALLARELADLVASLKLQAPGDLEVANAGQPGADGAVDVDVGALFLSGKAELIATSTVVGGYTAELGVFFMFALANNGFGTAGAAFGFLAPVAGGAVGLGLGTAAVLTMKDMTAGDANALRAFMLLGTWDSIMVPFVVLNAYSQSFESPPAPLIPAGMLLAQGAGVAAGAAAAAFADLPEGAGSMALSAGTWASALTLLGVAAVGGVSRDRPGDIVYVLTAVSNLGFAAGLVGAQWLPMTRAETWGVDVGGAVGLATGAAIAFGARAPNPLIGYGTIAAGAVVGMSAGFATVRYVPDMLGGLPEIVAVAPFHVEGGGGALVLGRF